MLIYGSARETSLIHGVVNQVGYTWGSMFDATLRTCAILARTILIYR